MKLMNLKINYRRNPIGIDDKLPLFGWNIETHEIGWRQEAYELLVSSDAKILEENQGDMWESKKTIDNKMVNIIYNGKPLKSGKRYFWKVRVWSGEGEVSSYSKINYFEMGLLKEDDWQGKWVGELEDHVNHIFRKEFQLEREFKEARIYICGLGHYELAINGGKIGEYVLEPGWTNYNKTCLYSVYDITSQLQKGKNAIGVILGDGMFNVPGGRYVYYERTYGKMKLLIQLNVEYMDGTKVSIVTDESWKMAKSPIQFACIYGGEDYDARLEQHGYSLADFMEDKSWQPIRIVNRPKGKLVAQNIYPLKVMKEIDPINVYETQSGIYIYDLGENFSGWAKITLESGEDFEGTEVIMTPSELLTIDNKPDQRVTGKNYHWKYTMNKEKKQSWSPRFTYYGFRYIQVEGAVPQSLVDKNEKKPIIKELVGQFIYPDIEITGEFNCSNLLFNQIHKIINQSILSNMKSVLTDCPHREKLGWLEQSHLIGPAIMYNYDVHNLYEKIQRDMKESQYDEGLVPDIVPEYVVFGYHKGFVDSPEWGSACIINPWYMYKKYGDINIFTKYYDVMCKYIDYLTSRTHHYILHHGLGDWLDIGPNTPYSQNTQVPIIATCIYYYDLCIMRQVAKLLGKSKDEEKYKVLIYKVKEEYNLQFYDDQTARYSTGSQAAQAMSLVVGLVEKENEQKVLDYLVKDIKARENSTTAGDIGHPFVLEALTLYNRSDIINDMMNVTDRPGYGYQVKCGATTLAEEWDGPDPKRPHGSQNHFMLGSGEEWFYSGLAGIRSLREDRPFDEIVIQPYFAEGVDYVKAWHMHPYGKIEVEWSKKNERIEIQLVIPPNTTAKFIHNDKQVVKELESGNYNFIF